MSTVSTVRPTRSRTLLAAAGSLALTATALGGLPTATAAPSPPAALDNHLVASGLDNPRMLSFGPDGSLYVAEAGRGGAGPCFPGPEGETCFGRSGAVTKIRAGRQTRVLTRLPSLAAEGGSGALGPADVAVRWGRYVVSVGLGADPAVRADLPPGGRRLGTLLTGPVGGDRLRVLANLGSYEAANDPDGGVPDSNPVGFTYDWRAVVAADAGGNSLQRVREGGATETLAVFPERVVPFPFPPPDEVPMQAVPTSVVKGPDGAFYVSQLTGFPFPANRARIFRVTRGGDVSIYARGLTNVTDLAFSGGRLYAVQLAGDGGLLAVPPETLPMGSLVRINRNGSTTTVADELPAPYGVALRGGSAYVTTCAVCAGGGAVMKIPLG